MKHRSITSILLVLILEIVILFNLLSTSFWVNAGDSVEPVTISTDKVDKKISSRKRDLMDEKAIIYLKIEPLPEDQPKTEEINRAEQTEEKQTKTDSIEIAIDVNANLSEKHYLAKNFKNIGRCHDKSGYSFTYYSEKVLPGKALKIPGRHVDDEGYVVDINNHICLASDDLPKGTVVSVPFGGGIAVVYDAGSGSGNLDVYVSW